MDPASTQPTILLVDDEDALREVLADFLRDCGYNIVSARSGGEAVQLFVKNRPDLILSDVRMPDGDAIFLLSKLRLLGDYPPVILISAHSDISENETLRLGAVRLIKKPFDLNTLLEAVRSCLPQSKT